MCELTLLWLEQLFESKGWNLSCSDHDDEVSASDDIWSVSCVSNVNIAQATDC